MSAPPLGRSIVDAIGATPMVELHRLKELLGFDGRLLVKLEYLNPGFSKKDRIALEMIRQAKDAGSLSQGGTVVELTSGNTGTGLAIVCRALGHPFVAVMSTGNTRERARMMRALGARVELVDQAPGSTPGQVSGEDLALVELRARELTEELGAFRANQFELGWAPLAHERHTGPEIWEQSGGTVDVFVDFIGSAGSFVGIARALRAHDPAIACYVVEPATAAPLSGGEVTNANHPIQGGGYSMAELPLLDRELVTGFLRVSDEEAIEATRTLAREEGIFAGPSTGANLTAALQVLREHRPRATVVFLACDSGLKYLSTDLYPDLDADVPTGA